MNDFIRDPDAFAGKMLTGFVGHGHRSLNPPTKAKRLSQANDDIAPLQSVVVITNFLNQATLILQLHLPRHFHIVTEPLAMVVDRAIERSFEGFGVHACFNRYEISLDPDYQIMDRATHRLWEWQRNGKVWELTWGRWGMDKQAYRLPMIDHPNFTQISSLYPFPRSDGMMSRHHHQFMIKK
jgi:hypothetical protein